MKIQRRLSAAKLQPTIDRFLELSGRKILSIDKNWDPADGTPVFTQQGRYTTRGWTEWTQGFQYGCAILQYDMTGEEKFLEMGRRQTIDRMAPHVSHIGVHDHGFNNLSTYGNLRRLMREGRIPHDQREMEFYELAIKLSGAVQAARWTPTASGTGFIHSFNGPHSLFSDTIRSLRILCLADQLGHVLMAEGDKAHNLLGRAIEHAITTSKFNVYYGEQRDTWDLPGRVVHESIFNTKDGNYRCPSTQQGYSAFSTWTRGLAWILTGYAEQLEFFRGVKGSQIEPHGITKRKLVAMMERAAIATAEFHIENSFADGIPFWDTGAPGVASFGRYTNKASDPYNDVEPLDASAAAISAQGYLRLGNYLCRKGDETAGQRYRSAGLTIAAALLEEPYLSTSAKHQGITLHSIYHRPNNWDYIPRGKKSPCGESAMWGDYHTMELALLVKREAEAGPYPTFFS
ncbi:MAG: glycosyl hydrolase [Gemmatimonadetes bacterium]|nr:glycosyl hydrolase [Gemmatimonadota bacterium]MBT6148288.1 glycosyl hydrolase [Gemmatimonadota bacterium]MBT7864310.1 glycosyl hydrolase [Gemmatimonadota bacterium]